MSRKIVARDVAIIYRGKNGQEAVVACNGIDLEIETGTFVSIVGPSGCGKTTLLYALDGLLPIQRGEISVDGKAITGPGTDRALPQGGRHRQRRQLVVDRGVQRLQLTRPHGAPSPGQRCCPGSELCVQSETEDRSIRVLAGAAFSLLVCVCQVEIRRNQDARGVLSGRPRR